MKRTRRSIGCLLRAIILALAFLPILSGSAQYDIGLSVGSFLEWTHVRRSNDRDFVSLQRIGIPPFTASLHFREQIGNKGDIGFELQFVRRAFHIEYGFNALGGYNNTEGDVVLNILYLTIAPQFKLNRSGTAVFRFGPMIGKKLGGRFVGERNSAGASSGVYTVTNSVIDGPLPDLFKGDIRFLVGLGLLRPWNDTWRIGLDLYSSMTVFSAIKDPRGVGMFDLGLSLGIAHRSGRRPISIYLDPIPEKVGK